MRHLFLSIVRIMLKIRNCSLDTSLGSKGLTGAAQDSPGLIAKADGGILFLDEIHRLPPEGQEMLFTFIDKGIYRPLGESAQVHEASVQIIGATTESSESFLSTFNRRIPMAITLPNLASRSLDERYEIISFIKQEANRLNQRIDIEKKRFLPSCFMMRKEISVK